MKARNVLLYFSFTLYFFLIGHNSFAQNLAIKVNPATCQTIGTPIVLSDIVEIAKSAKGEDENGYRRRHALPAG